MIQYFNSLSSETIYDSYLYLIGGQSNAGTNPATGRVDYSEIPAYLSATMSNVKYWDEVNDFTTSYTQPATHQWGFPLEYWFRMSAHKGDIYTVKYGQGGTQLAEGGPYTSFNRSVFKAWALAALNKVKITYENPKVVMIWCQGYTDALDQTNSLAYGTNLTNWFNEVRSHIGINNMPVIYNRLHQDVNPIYKGNVRTGQESSVNSINIMINSDTFELDVDGAHYTAQGSIDLGNKFYDTSKSL